MLKTLYHKTLLFIIVFVAASLQIKAQDDLEYKWEIGAGVGLMSYQGDLNGSIIKNNNPSFSIVLKRVFNPYSVVAINTTLGTLKGNTRNLNTYIQNFQNQEYSFNTKIVDLSATYEYNFWPYGTGKEYRGAKRFTPYILGGLGLTYAKAPQQNVFTANIPMGIGLKYKLKERLNLSIQWAMHFSLSDNLDGTKDPYNIKSSGLFKNTDSFSELRIAITYSFAVKCKTCHNDDE